MSRSSRTVEAGHRSIEVSRPDKLLFPDDGITKLDLVRYYARVADTMLPHLRDRLAHMHRYPDGLEGEDFHHKRVPEHFPEWVERRRVSIEDGHATQLVIQDAATLAYIAEQGTITPHAWLSRSDRLDNPDQMIFDLDPPGDGFGEVQHAARSLRNLLEELELPAFAKLTGSRGVHVIVPLDRRASFDEVRALAREVATTLAERDPDRLTVEMRKERRRGRLFVDWLRNAYGQTAVAPYAVRARPGAPVGVPIDWGELGRVKPDSFTTGNVFRRLSRKRDPWRDMWKRAQGITPARERLERLGA